MGFNVAPLYDARDMLKQGHRHNTRSFILVKRLEVSDQYSYIRAAKLPLTLVILLPPIFLSYILKIHTNSCHLSVPRTVFITIAFIYVYARCFFRNISKSIYLSFLFS